MCTTSELSKRNAGRAKARTEKGFLWELAVNRDYGENLKIFLRFSRKNVGVLLFFWPTMNTTTIFVSHKKEFSREVGLHNSRIDG